MTGSLFDIFNKEVFYPNNLADKSFNDGVIYHGVNKHLMTGLLAYMTPLKAMVFGENAGLDFSESNVIVLAKSKESWWVFSTIAGEGTGSIGRLKVDVMTVREFLTILQRHIVGYLAKKGNRCVVLDLSGQEVRFA